AEDTHAVRPIRGDRHVEHRAGAAVLRKSRADRRVLGQLDDPGVIVAELELARRAHHAVALDPADRALLELEAAGRDHRARRPEHADEARAGIRRAAYDLQRLAVAVVDGEDLQVVRVRMRRRGQHPRDAEAGELLGRAVQRVRFGPERGELGRALRGAGLRLGVLLQPGERDLQPRAPTPPESVGWSKALTPSCRSHRTSPSKKARKSSIPYLSIASRSPP